MKNNLKKLILLAGLVALVLVGCNSNNSTTSDTNDENIDRPHAWIADRTIKGLVFQSAGDASADSMSDEIAAYIKERTGITLELEGISSEDSSEALAAGLAAGDLPDFIAFYLNHSGRPEFPLFLKAANEEMFHDISDYLREGKIYSKYFEEGYLPTDTKEIS